MSTIFVKPGINKTGKPNRVRLPDKPHLFLPEEGDFVPANKFWLRRLRDGSVVVAEPPKTSKPAKKE